MRFHSPAGFPSKGVDLGGVAEEVGAPLIGVAANESVEIVEAHAVRPLGERSDLAGLIRGSVVVLAEPAGRVAVIAQDATDRGFAFGDNAVVAGEAGGLLGNHAEADRVVVSARDQGGPCGRAECRGEDPVVPQSVGGDAIHGGCRDDSAERAGDAEAGVVGHDEQDVGGFFGRNDAWGPPGFRVECIRFDHAAEFWSRRGELFAGNCRGGRRRTGRAGDLLST